MYVWRQQQMKGNESMERIAMDGQRVMEMQLSRQRTMFTMEQRLNQIARQKQQMNATFKFFVAHNRPSVAAMKEIAGKYGVNADAVEERNKIRSAAPSRTSTRQPSTV
jgi:hypothetical protein